MSIDIKNNDGVTTLSLNRPKKRNALDRALIDGLHDAFVKIDNDSDTRLIILRAAGSHFCAGADLSWMKESIHLSNEENLDDAQQLVRLLSAIDQCSKPTIALVQGAAMGGALGLIACCDIALASGSAFFAFPEVKLGLMPATIAPYVIQAIGARAARRYFLTGERFSAEKACELGLIHDVVADLNHAVERLIETILANGQHAMCETKHLIRDTSSPDPHLLKQMAERIARLRTHPDTQARIAAFFEKK